MVGGGLRWLRAWLVLAGLGATLGVLLDGIHTHFGATAYTHPVFWRMAWWLPLLFGGAFSIGLLRPLLDRIFDHRAPSPSTGRALVAMGFFIAAYWLSVLPLAWPQAAGILFAVFALSWWLCDRTWVGLAIAAAAAFGGPTVESILVSQGTFVHLQTVAYGIPGWLPFLYMNAAVGLTSLAKRLVD
jgi:hypothetical protein